MVRPLLLLALIGAAAAADRGEYFNTSSGPVNIVLVHHASLVIEAADRAVYVDPTAEGNYKGLPKADLVLVTNDRPDHFDPAAISRYSKKTTAIIAPPGPAARLAHSTALGKGETVSLGEIMIHAESARPAAASTQTNPGNGYVLTYPGLRIYISGDTGFYPEMKAIKNIDIAFLSMGTPDSMSLDDAVKSAEAIRPKVLYPNHFRDMSVDDIRQQFHVAETEVRVRNWY